MNSVGCVDVGMKLVIRRSDANGEVVGGTEIVEKEIGLLLESDGRFGHAHSEKRAMVGLDMRIVRKEVANLISGLTSSR